MRIDEELRAKLGLDPLPQALSDADYHSIVLASARIFALACLEILAPDQHQFSTRPCTTCRRISGLLGQPWGCSAMAAA